MPRSNRRKAREWVIEEFSLGVWRDTSIVQTYDDHGIQYEMAKVLYRKNAHVRFEFVIELFARLAKMGDNLEFAEAIRARNVKTGEILPFALFS